MPITNPPALAAKFPSVEAHGHSWISGFGITEQKYNFINRIARNAGATTQNTTNTGISGGLAAGPDYNDGVAKLFQHVPSRPQAEVTGPYFGYGGLKICMTAYNDFSAYGDTASSRLMVEHALTGIFATLRAARYLVPGTGMTVNAGWLLLADTTISMPGSGVYYTQTNGSTIDFALDSKYNGEAFTIMCPSVNGTAGTVLNFTLDPAGANTSLGSYDQGADNTGLVGAPGGSRVAVGMCGGFRVAKGVVSPGVHTIRVTASAIAASNYAEVTGMVIEGNNPIVVPLVPARAAIQTASPGSVAWSNERNTNVAASFHNMHVVDLTAALIPTGTSADDINWFDTNHPNNLGNARVAAAITAAIENNLSVDAIGEMNFPLSQPITTSYKEVVKAATTGPLQAVNYLNTNGSSITPGLNATLTTTTNIALAAQDGVTINVGDRLLVKDQAAPLQNGVYVLTQLGNASQVAVLSRAPDAGPATLLTPKHEVKVDQGAVNAGTIWTNANDGTITVGTTPVYYSRSAPDYGLGTWREPTLPIVPAANLVIATARLQNMPRFDIGAGVFTPVTAFHWWAGGLVIPAGRTVSGAMLYAIAAGTQTARQVTLIRASDRLILAASANSAAAYVPTAFNTQAFAATYTAPIDTPVIVAIGVVATVVPTFGAATGLAPANFGGGGAAILSGQGQAASTTPLVVGGTATAPTAGQATVPWVGLY